MRRGTTSGSLPLKPQRSFPHLTRLCPSSLSRPQDSPAHREPREGRRLPWRQRDELGGWRGPQQTKGSPRVKSQAQGPRRLSGAKCKGISGASLMDLLMPKDPSLSLPPSKHLSWNPNSFPSPTAFNHPVATAMASLHPPLPPTWSHQSSAHVLHRIFNKHHKV